MARIFLAVFVIIVFAGGMAPLLLMGNNKSDASNTKVQEQAQEQVQNQNQQVKNVNNTNNMSDYLKKEVIQAGTGKEVQKGSRVLMHYKGMLEDGTVFDSSYGREPFETTIGVGYLIKGWDEGVPGMKEGEKAKLTIKSEWGYGASGIPGTIPGNATLIFEVEVVQVLS